ncbi:hypothetical protein BJV82DRAFT_584320 [Fennellomyces sp. T-0311]|nr:hypothetical protein BJV82DRAFT_584320 [Fennellomyces sp. T-0311]
MKWLKLTLLLRPTLPLPLRVLLLPVSASLPVPASLFVPASLPVSSSHTFSVATSVATSSSVVSSSSAPASIAKKQRKPRPQIREYAKLKGGEIDVGMSHLVAKGYTKKNAASAATVKQSTLQTYDMRCRANGNEKVTKKKRGPQPKRIIIPEIKQAICEYLVLHSIVTVHQVKGMIAQRFKKTIAFNTMQKYLCKDFKLGLRGVHTWPELLEADDEDDVDVLGMDLMGAHGTKCVFVGEAGFDVNYRRRFPSGKEDELVTI